jgi:uncharacterized protein (TIGR00645 family)
MKPIERAVETIILFSRWLMALFYLGLVLSLLVLLLKFGRSLFEFMWHAPNLTESGAILGILDLIDTTLIGSLVLVVIFSGYENFVSKIDGTGHPDWPEWMAKVNFAGLKQKLLASILAISAIQVLKAFMNIDKYDPTRLGWLVGIHVAFVFSLLILSISDRLSAEPQTGNNSIKH